MNASKLHAGLSTRSRETGTVLLATAIVIIAVAGMSLVLLSRSQNNVIQYRQDRREVQADYVADTAVSFGVAELNTNWLTKHTTAGSMSGKEFVIHSGDDRHEPIQVAGAGLRGHPRHDGIDNNKDGQMVDQPSDNALVDPAHDEVKPDGSYKGGIYRVRVREWVKQSSGKGEIGAEGMDDDGDGQTDEAEEVRGYTSSNSRHFTLVIEASYGNYTIEKRTFTNAVQTKADKFGIYSEGDLTTFPNGLIDSYDSSKGKYGGSNTASDGNIGAEGDLTVKPGTVVKGDARYMGSKTIQGTVTGSVGPLSSPQKNDPWWIERNLVSPSGTKTVKSGTTERIDPKGKPGYEQLQVNAGGTAIIPKGRTITFGDGNSGSLDAAITSGGGGGGGGGKGKGGGGGGGGAVDATVQIGSGAQVYIEENWVDGADTNIILNGPTSDAKTPTRIYIANKFSTNNRTDIIVNGRVEMYVVDKFNLGPKSTVNVTTDKPPHFSLSVGGTWWKNKNKAIVHRSSPGSEVTIKPNSSWQGIIYAPKAQGNKAVSLYPNGEFFGSLIARNIDMKPNFNFHYDESIASKCHLKFVPCNWVVDNSNSWIVAQRGQGPLLD